MTKNSIVETIFATFPEAVNARNHTNFIAVPLEDGRYASVKVTVLPDKEIVDKNGKVRPAYDHEAAVAAYAAQQEAIAARKAEAAAKPKAKVSHADPEKAAIRKTRQNALVDYLKTMGGVEFTSTDLLTAVADIYEGTTGLLTLGADLTAIAKEDNNLTFRKEKGKKFWTYNG